MANDFISLFKFKLEIDQKIFLLRTLSATVYLVNKKIVIFTLSLQKNLITMSKILIYRLV